MKRSYFASLIVMTLMASALSGAVATSDRDAVPETVLQPTEIQASALGPVYTPAFLLDLVVTAPYACEENLACTRDLDCEIFWGEPTYVCNNPGGTPCGGFCIPC